MRDASNIGRMPLCLAATIVCLLLAGPARAPIPPAPADDAPLELRVWGATEHLTVTVHADGHVTFEGLQPTDARFWVLLEMEIERERRAVAAERLAKCDYRQKDL